MIQRFKILNDSSKVFLVGLKIVCFQCGGESGHALLKLWISVCFGNTAKCFVHRIQTVVEIVSSGNANPWLESTVQLLERTEQL